MEKRSARRDRRVEFVDGVALVPLSPRTWFRLADQAAEEGCGVEALLERLTRPPRLSIAPMPARGEPPLLGFDPARAGRAVEALTEIEDRYHSGDDEDDVFLAWLDKALRAALA
ncbi:MAG: hypothetical protein V4755_07555 [Curtobacterium sp.]